MRYLLLMIPMGTEPTAPGTMPGPELAVALLQYNDSLRQAGVLLAFDWLHPPSMGAWVSFPGGISSGAEGRLPGGRAAVGGYWLIQAKSQEEAIQWASRYPAANKELIEVRQVQELSDFAPELR